jgi:Type II secretion system protein B
VSAGVERATEVGTRMLGPAPAAPSAGAAAPRRPFSALEEKADTGSIDATASSSRPSSPSSSRPSAPRSEPRERPVPALTDLPGELKSSIPPIRLEVLVYSDNAADRLVFINSRKYVEGQQIDEKLTVERIAEDGVVLSYLGQRFLLRQ